MLAQAAGERGIHTFTGTYFAENRPVAALIDTTDDPADQVTSHGVATFSVTLQPPDPRALGHGTEPAMAGWARAARGVQE